MARLEMSAARQSAARPWLAKTLLLAALCLLFPGCQVPESGYAEPEHAEGTWTGYAQFGTAYPVLSKRYTGEWPIVMLRNYQGPPLGYPHTSGPLKHRPPTSMRAPSPVLVDDKSRVIQLGGVNGGDHLAISGTMRSAHLHGPGGIDVTTVEPGWVFGQPVIRVDHIERILPNGSREKVKWTRLGD